MASPVAQESSTLKVVATSIHIPTVALENIRKPDEKDSLYCDYCNKRRHTKETCFKLDGPPQWKNDNRRKGFSNGRRGGRRGGRNGGLRAYTQLMRSFHLHQPAFLPTIFSTISIPNGANDNGVCSNAVFQGEFCWFYFHGSIRPLVMVRKEEAFTTLSCKRWNKRAAQEPTNQQVDLILRNKSDYDIND
ncbi:uncharacterized protein LOC113314290 [Papaver somniferum]|uniref:uncharacterized protein LOC113314290 n=1 Tax=Papaver somniferum TaxID=3469 RepID=UPI000E703BAB|nr:uncharacterized protein LOC113314290 [Papaver somniferum]